MRTLWICLTWGLLGWGLLGWGLPRSAHAYCLTHTCEFSGTELCTWDAGRGCWTGGTVARWGSSCIHYAVHADGSPEEGISAAALSAALAAGFRTWSSVACGADGLSPELTAVERGLTRCDQVEFNCAAPEDNDNIVLFRDGRSDLADTIIALTTTVANISTGQILDVDVEINSAAFDFYVAQPDPRANAHDLQLVLNHELGHFLGLSHTLEPGALMRAEYDAADRAPGADDIAGICQSLHPSSSDPECSLGPSPGTCVGTDASCPAPAALRHDDGGCALGPGRSRDGRSGAVLLLGVALGLLTRRQRPLKKRVTGLSTTGR
ncbi:MAG: hypothetical protein RL685_6722 [Pseudomonadota bacterium]|jgi:hypothetical protein